MRAKRSIKDSLKSYLNWCVGRLLLGGSRDDTVRAKLDANTWGSWNKISMTTQSGGGAID